LKSYYSDADSDLTKYPNVERRPAVSPELSIECHRLGPPVCSTT